ncbi:MAG: hypothetical protein ABI321_20175 [Polyangia bacterium]
MRALLVALMFLACGTAHAVDSTYPYAVVKKLPAGVEVTGAVVEARSFSDATGDHIVVVTHTDEATGQRLHIVHFAHRGAEAWRTVAHVDDEVRGCKQETTLQLVPRAIVITDLDADEHAEIVFAWEKSCRSTLGPDELVLMVMADDAQYAMHGSTELMARRRDGVPQKLIESGPLRAPRVDAALTKQKPFASFAATAWETWKVQLYVRQ